MRHVWLGPIVTLVCAGADGHGGRAAAAQHPVHFLR